MSKWIWVSLPYATYGIEVEDGIVIDAAPIARWMIGKDTQTVRNWIAKKGGVWKMLPDVDNGVKDVLRGQ